MPQQSLQETLEGESLFLHGRGDSSSLKRRPTTRFALAVLAVGVLIAVPAALATSPGKNGRIVYMVKDAAGHWQVWVANPDLLGAKKLTRGRYDTGWAVWSPGGKWLVFDSSRTDHTPNNSRHVNDVFVMKPDGSGVKKLTDSKGVSGDAAWSPNGSLIAFEADRGNRKGLSAIYVMHANGRKLRRVTNPRPPLSDYKPRFSPDGTHLVFSRARGTADHARAALFTVRLDGSGLHRLTSYALHVEDSDWSPTASGLSSRPTRIPMRTETSTSSTRPAVARSTSRGIQRASQVRPIPPGHRMDAGSSFSTTES